MLPVYRTEYGTLIARENVYKLYLITLNTAHSKPNILCNFTEFCKAH
jgi:hypothetical protein